MWLAVKVNWFGVSSAHSSGHHTNTIVNWAPTNPGFYGGGVAWLVSLKRSVYSGVCSTRGKETEGQDSKHGGNRSNGSWKGS